MSKDRKKKPARRQPSAQFIAGHPGPTIEAGSKTWRLGFNTQNAKARLEELIRAHVTREGLKLKRDVGGEDGDEVWQEYRDSLASGHYDTFGPGWFKVLKSLVGNKLFLLSLLQKHHPDATESDALDLLANHRDATEAALNVISPDFLSAVAREVATSRGATPQNADAFAADLIAKASLELATRERATATA
ncbi:MAG: hypothetical protein E6Q76_19585 [Rhizobium sp.]|nr:MAG: hypothetical protein E6Q76_19585 [Rhizobium sp.]